MLKIVGLTQILTTFGMHRDAMKVQYVLSNKEYLTKQNKKYLHALKIPVNVHFIDTLIHNIAYSITLQILYLLCFKNVFSKLECLLIILLLKLVDLVEPTEFRENVYIEILIVYKMNFLFGQKMSNLCIILVSILIKV